MGFVAPVVGAAAVYVGYKLIHEGRMYLLGTHWTYENREHQDRLAVHQAAQMQYEAEELARLAVDPQLAAHVADQIAALQITVAPMWRRDP